jgi:hypothetical protein
MFDPATTGSGESTFETKRSAVAATAGTAGSNSALTTVNAKHIHRSDAFTVAPPPRVSWFGTFLLHPRSRHHNLQLREVDRNQGVGASEVEIASTLPGGEGGSPRYIALNGRASRPLRNPYPTVIEPCIQG